MEGLLQILMLQSILMGFCFSSDSESREECEIKEVNGFLMNVCETPAYVPEQYLNFRIRIKCINSEEFYNVSWKTYGRIKYVTVDDLCSNDPYFYQACAVNAIRQRYDPYQINSHLDHDRGIESGQFPCGFLCIEKYSQALVAAPTLRTTGECSANHDCWNTVSINKTFCPEEADGQCDEKCETPTCLDESFCNGFSYGLWCDNHTNYIPVPRICDGNKQCEDRMDESICKVDNETEGTCKYFINGEPDQEIEIPLYNFTRCRPLNHFRFVAILFSYCHDFLDQTNCSDRSRIGLHCPIHGFMSTVARQVICPTAIQSSGYDFELKIPPICDDNLDKACITASHSCVVHKHQLCDGSQDCPDNSDEAQLDCQFMTDQRCVRKFVFQGSEQSSNFSIPFTWVQDGVSDCLNGVDETDDWPTCGHDRTYRLKDQFNSSCSEVFLCPGSDDFIVFSRLCDKIDSCGNENLICEKSRGQPAIMQHALRSENDVVTLLYCLKGLNSILDLKNESCVVKEFNHSERTIFGKNHSSNIWFPETKMDCTYFYGESYVFLSCLQTCTISLCPIISERRTGLDHCPGQLTRSKVFSVDDNGKIAVLMKNDKTRQLNNDIFFCKDTSVCLTYDKVCNLVDDCGDGSDESMCSNHFQCEESREYISLNQKCDKIFHCLDLSDECNNSCGETIINGSIVLKFMAWFIGILALFLNIYSFIKNMFNLRTCRSEAAFITNSLVILISFGDFLIGIYLTLLAFFDSYRGQKHCKMQTEWLTSISCVSLGIINCLGSEISLFSMTVLSIIRAIGSVQSKFSPSKDRSIKSVVKVTAIVFIVFLICFLISYVPILKSFEDYFVNGVRYEKHNTLLLGCPGKRGHMSILGQYYGRMRPTRGLLSWSQVNGLMASMFSKDYGGIRRETLSFYGNDPVCVFKYFVRMDDPQKYFSLFILSFNCLCFITITVSYFAIALESRNSTRALKSKAENKIQNAAAEETNARLQRVVHMIIFSDFLCWIPFTITCWLHFFNVVDAKPWYPTFSILVLPINSVVNPLLYDKSMSRAIDSVFVTLKTKILNKLKKPMLSKGPEIELENRVEDKVEERNVASAEL